MKNLSRFLPICVVMLFAAKIIVLGEIATQVPGGNPSVLSVNRALAEAAPKVIYKPPVKDCLEDGLISERSLAASLQTERMNLDEQQAAIKAEEQRLLSLKNEIIQKIDALRALEEKLDGKIEEDKSAEAKKYRDLAKVYEAAPPAKAGAMLEKLDIHTAAGITMSMKREKAGVIWGYINPQRAVEITAAITRSQVARQNTK